MASRLERTKRRISKDRQLNACPARSSTITWAFLLVSTVFFFLQAILITTGLSTLNQSSLFPSDSSGSEGILCNAELHSTETLWIAMPSWRNPILLHRALASVYNQVNIPYGLVHVVVMEDYSAKMFTSADLSIYENSPSSKFNVTFLRNSTASEKLGSAYGKWEAFNYIRDQARPHEYVFVLDGDDTLSDKRVLHDLYGHLHRGKPRFALGRMNGLYSEQCGNLEGKDPSRVRKVRWSFCHPRVFQAHLLRTLKKSHFQRKDGSWLQKGTDRVFIYPFLERAGPDRFLYFGEDRPYYNYTVSSDNGLIVFDKDIIAGDKNEVNSRSPVTESLHSVVVVTCIFNRQNAEEFLRRLWATQLQPKHALEIHVCNNNHTRQSQLEDLAEALRNRRGDLHGEQLYTQAIPHKIQIHDMGRNLGGFARFLLARKLMVEKPIDYIIMVDDDQYVRPSTIAEVYSSRLPQHYLTWYGKNWHATEKSYWKPVDVQNLITDPTLRAHDKTSVITYQYGGTGMSIVDASVFGILELYDLEQSEFMFLEDIWLSHIVNVLEGWKIGRLFVEFDAPSFEYMRNTGLYMQIYSLKDRLFARVGYLKCKK